MKKLLTLHSTRNTKSKPLVHASSGWCHTPKSSTSAFWWLFGRFSIWTTNDKMRFKCIYLRFKYTRRNHDLNLRNTNMINQIKEHTANVTEMKRMKMEMSTSKTLGWCGGHKRTDTRWATQHQLSRWMVDRHITDNMKKSQWVDGGWTTQYNLSRCMVNGHSIDNIKSSQWMDGRRTHEGQDEIISVDGHMMDIFTSSRYMDVGRTHDGQHEIISVAGWGMSSRWSDDPVI